jgi:hypothetical protein
MKPEATERLTWEEICERYPNEWLTLAEVERTPEQEEVDDDGFLTAVVRCHAPTRKEMFRQLKELDLEGDLGEEHYTGEIKLPTSITLALWR